MTMPETLIDFDAAIAIVTRELYHDDNRHKDSLKRCAIKHERLDHVVFWDLITELDYGWVFPHADRAKLLDGEIVSGLGFGPIIVTRWGHSENIGGGSLSFEQRSRRIERMHRPLVRGCKARKLLARMRGEPWPSYTESPLYQAKLEAYREYLIQVPEEARDWIAQARSSSAR